MLPVLLWSEIADCERHIPGAKPFQIEARRRTDPWLRRQVRVFFPSLAGQFFNRSIGHASVLSVEVCEIGRVPVMDDAIQRSPHGLDLALIAPLPLLEQKGR